MLQTQRDQLLQGLKRQLDQFLTVDVAATHAASDLFSTGVPAADALLPRQGIPRGGIIEWLSPEHGAGAASLALAGVQAALHRSDWGCWVVIDPQGEFFPPAVQGWGIPLERLLLIRPATPQDAAWAFEQSLRCPGVAVTWNWVGRTSERMLQRWKVAAEVGQGQGVLFRSTQALQQASWADVRWRVQPLPKRPTETRSRRIRLELAYCRGILGAKQIDLECDDEAGCVRVAPPLVHSTSGRRAAGA